VDECVDVRKDAGYFIDINVCTAERMQVSQSIYIFIKGHISE